MKKFRRFDVGRKKLKKSIYVFVIFSFLNIQYSLTQSLNKGHFRGSNMPRTRLRGVARHMFPGKLVISIVPINFLRIDRTVGILSSIRGSMRTVLRAITLPSAAREWLRRRILFANVVASSYHLITNIRVDPLTECSPSMMRRSVSR